MQKKGKNTILEVVFLPIDKISMIEGKSEALAIKNNTIIRKGMVDIPPIIYNPTKFNRKKNIKAIRELSQHPNIHLINEHHHLNNKYVFEILQSQSEVAEYVQSEMEQVDSSFTFYLLGQKNSIQQWDASILYAKDLDGRIYSYEEANLFINENNLEKKNVNELLNQISQKVLGIIQYYYPGLYEVGLQFIVKHNSEITLKSFCTKKSIERDLFEWNQALWEKIVEWPIELAYEMMLKIEHLGEIHNQNEQEGSEFQSIINQYAASNEKANRLFNFKEEIERTVWVKLKPFKDDEVIIKVPRGILKHTLNQLLEIQFGIKKETCVYFINDESAFLRNNSYEYPIEIYVSTSLVEKMQIPLSLVYQLNIAYGKVMFGPTIGFLLGEKTQIYNPEYMEKFSDRLGGYEKFGGLVIAFSPRSIDWNKEIVYGMIYDPEQKKWKYDSAPIPSSPISKKLPSE